MTKKKIRLPARRCAACGGEAGGEHGQRIAAGQSSDVHVVTKGEVPVEAAGADVVCRARRLPRELGGGVLVGKGAAATAEALDRAQRDFAEGLRPWVCQKCDGPWCPACGAVLTRAVARDVLYDDGETAHVPVIAGFGVRCSNPDCGAQPPRPVLTVG